MSHLDLLTGEMVEDPPARPRRTVQHSGPTMVPLMLYETLGMAEEATQRPRPIGPADSPAKPAPHVRGSATSKAAADRLSPVNLVGKRERLLDLLCEFGAREGKTDNELIAMCTGIGWSSNGVRPRRVELARAGWIEEAGTRNGCTVWKPTAAALRWAEEK